MSEPTLSFNGINGATGDYALPSMAVTEFAEKIRRHHLSPRGEGRGVKAGINARCLQEAGWGVVFAEGADQQVRDALRALLDLRQGLSPRYFRELKYLPGENRLSFLARHHVGPGPVDPKKVPYYLLIVGGPEEIPFRFQQDLDVQYAVGRVAFETLEEYERYATSVVEVETQKITRPRRATFFGVCNHDQPTRLSQEKMVLPLAQKVREDVPDWDVQMILGQEAVKARLLRHLEGEEEAAFLFTAGHAVCFSSRNEERQRQRQGALLMSDWPGPVGWEGPIPEDYYFAASDLSEKASLHGLISFHFACFSAGTPEYDAFAQSQGRRLRVPITREPFVGLLPQKLLSHPNGGALAVIGHVDRAWESSFLWPDAGSQLAVFESLAHELLTGVPVGLAMEHFGQRYSDIAVAFCQALLAAQETGADDVLQTARLWTAYHDAQGYVILGDPAVRVCASEAS
jgi:hypothetical protein